MFLFVFNELRKAKVEYIFTTIPDEAYMVEFLDPLFGQRFLVLFSLCTHPCTKPGRNIDQETKLERHYAARSHNT